MEMSSKQQQIPAIRFNGFTDAWEQRKFSSIVNRVSVQSNDSNLPKVEFEDIISGEGRLNKDVSQKFDSRKGTIFEPEYILYGKLRPYLKNWLYPDFKGIALGDFWVFEQNNSSSIFDYYLIQSDKYQTVANLSSGTKMPRSDWKTVSETVFNIPTKIEEQEKIGSFFKQLDDTIALHQRQLDNYKYLKKAMMQKIFNQELCFKDEEGNEYPEWEEKKVSDLFSITRGVVISKPSISEYKSSETPYPVFSSQTSNFGILGWSSEYDFEGLYLTWTTDGAGAGKVFSRTGKFRCTNVCGVLVGKIESYSNSCIKELLEKETPKHVSYVGNPKLMNNVMGQIKITVPSLKEQLAISDLFELFDRKILFQENLIEKFREQKEALMQQMFI